MVRWAAVAVLAGVVFGTGVTPAAELGEFPLELRYRGQGLVGHLLEQDGTRCWFEGRDGRLRLLEMGEVSDFKRATGAFRPYNSAELRDQLQREFRGQEVTGHGHYLIVGPRGETGALGQSFEQHYRSVRTWLSARGFPVREPKFPLVAIVFPTREAFFDYCRQENVQPRPEMAGCYFPMSNRVALFLRDSTGLDATVLHEATHQVAFNVGLHTRRADDPLWLAEGLAMSFESAAFRQPVPGATAADRINPERWEAYWAGHDRRKAGWLAAVVADDGLFQREPLEAYARAWAVMFYLSETRPSEMTAYLKKVAARGTGAYSEDERLKDFRAAFGKDVARLEVELQRFMGTLVR